MVKQDEKDQPSQNDESEVKEQPLTDSGKFEYTLRQQAKWWFEKHRRGKKKPSDEPEDQNN